MLVIYTEKAISSMCSRGIKVNCNKALCEKARLDSR